MNGDDQPTCGQGLAASAVLPQAIGETLAAMAEVLAAHMTSLDLTDEHARVEHAAYAHLAENLRRNSSELTTSADAMLGYRDLPMARHDMEAMSHQVEPFKQFVAKKRELLSLLATMDDEDQAALAEMND